MATTWVGHQRDPLLGNSGTQGRYELLDSDEYRLPDGMQRVGYDADTQIYSFRDSEGDYWESEEGNRFGRLHRTAAPPPHLVTSRSVTDHARYEDWRYLAPFAVFVCVVLLLLLRFVGSSPSCGEGWKPRTLANGDTCWKLATERGTTVEELLNANPKLDCDRLSPGMQLCVPEVP